MAFLPTEDESTEERDSALGLDSITALAVGRRGKPKPDYKWRSTRPPIVDPRKVEEIVSRPQIVEKSRSNGHSEAKAPDPRRGPTYKELDLAEVEQVMATSETVEEGAKRLGLTSAQLYTRRQRDEAVSQAVDRGRETYYANAPEIDLNAEEDEPSEKSGQLAEPEKVIPQIIPTTTERPPCGCGRPWNHKGRCSARRAAAGGDFPASKPARNVQKSDKKRVTEVETEIVKPQAVQIVDVDKTEDKIESHFIGRYHVKYEGITIYCDTPEEVIEIASHLQGQIAPPARAVPTKVIKRAWSLDFEGEAGKDDSTVGLTYLYLISMLHDGMESHEKEAVWTLVQYLKRMEAAVEAQKGGSLTQGADHS